MRISRRRKIRC